MTRCGIKKNLEGRAALKAVKQDGYAIQYVPESALTEEIILKAVKQDGYAIRYVPESMFKNPSVNVIINGVEYAPVK